MRVSAPKYAAIYLSRHRSEAMMIVMGLTMVILGLFKSPWNVVELYSTNEFKSSVAALILLITGLVGILAAIRYPQRITISAGIMTLGMVWYYIFFVAFMLPDSEDSGDVNYMLRLMMYILLAFCVIFAVKIIVGSTHNTKRIVFVELIFLVLLIVMYILNIHHGMKISEAIGALSDYQYAFILIVVSLICLNMSDSKYVSPMKRLRMNVEAMETSTITVNDTYMTRESLYMILDRDYSKWEESEEPEIERQLNVVLYNRLRREMLVIRKWKDDEDLTGTFLPRDLKVHQFKHINFPIRHIAFYPEGRDECDKVRMYGDNGFFVDVMVRDTHIRKYRADVNVTAVFGLKLFHIGKRGVEKTADIAEASVNIGEESIGRLVGKDSESEEPDSDFDDE